MMKAITLWEPWASLVACGVKTYETRSWRPPIGLIGQRIAIHSAKSTAGMKAFPQEFLPARFEPRYGAVLCTAVLADVGRVVKHRKIRGERFGRSRAVLSNGDEPYADPYGDYSVGRWLWKLGDVTPCDPVPAQGMQGIWTLPEETEAAVRAQGEAHA